MVEVVRAVRIIRPTIAIERESIDGLPMGGREIWARHEDRPDLDVKLATVHYSYAYIDNGTMPGVAEKVAALFGGTAAYAARSRNPAQSICDALYKRFDDEPDLLGHQAAAWIEVAGEALQHIHRYALAAEGAGYDLILSVTDPIVNDPA